MSSFVWGLIGPGAIAQRFAEAVHGLPGVRLGCVLGRDPARTAAFAARWGAQPAPDLHALLADPGLDAIYIATPHAQHGELVRACLLAGKPVLCEKPLVPGLAQAAPLVALAAERGVFLMEALWTRFLPVFAQVRAWLDAGAIGPVRAIQSSFCFAAPFDPASRLYDPALAGGTLLDIGIYNLAMTRWVLEPRPGACPEPLSLRAEGLLAPTGVDQRVAATLLFEGGVSSQFVCAFDGAAENALHILGERGYIRLPRNFWEATRAELHAGGAAPILAEAPFRINGFEGEIEEAMRCIRAGRVESPQMPHAETLALQRWIDTLRQQLGVRYPFE